MTNKNNDLEEVKSYIVVRVVSKTSLYIVVPVAKLWWLAAEWRSSPHRHRLRSFAASSGTVGVLHSARRRLRARCSPLCFHKHDELCPSAQLFY